MPTKEHRGADNVAMSVMELELRTADTYRRHWIQNEVVENVARSPDCGNVQVED